MKIGMLGSGNMGSGLGKVLANAGHDVCISSRTKEKAAEKARAMGQGVRGGTIREAVQFGDVVFITTPWETTEALIKEAGPLDNKVLVDCTNPLTPDLSDLSIGHTTSAAEEVAKIAPEARVVKAFNTAFASIYQEKNRMFGSRMATMFYCGDDDDAKKIVKELIKDVGFQPIDAGPLSSARYLEMLAMLMIRLAYGQGMGTHFHLNLVRR